MRRELLAIAALSAAIGYSIAGANAAPVVSMLETLKAGASEGGMAQEVRYRKRGYGYKKTCWWGDKWLCRYMW